MNSDVIRKYNTAVAIMRKEQRMLRALEKIGDTTSATYLIHKARYDKAKAEVERLKALF